MSDNWVNDIPIYPLSVLLDDYLQGAEKYGNMPGQPVTLKTFYEGLKQRIVRTNCEITEAKNRDDVAAAETRLKLFKGELEKMESGLRKGIIEGLLQTVYACVGHLNGRRVIIPAKAWSGQVDWENESLSFEGCAYTRLRTIVGKKLTPEQRALVKKYLVGELDDSPQEGPGRPNKMFYVRGEFDRRKKAGTVLHPLKAEAEWLASWFKREHSDKLPLQYRTILNKLREEYKEYENGLKKSSKL